MPNPVDFHPLSAAAAGTGIKIVATATPGTALHVTGISATVYDEPTITVVNTHTANVDVTVEFGGVTNPDNVIQSFNIPFKSGETIILPGTHALNGTGAAGRTIAMFASVANVIVAYGSINRISGVS